MAEQRKAQLWLACPLHPDGQTCWVCLSEKNWPDLAGRTAVFCYECKRPIALIREGTEYAWSPTDAIRELVDRWDEMTDLIGCLRPGGEPQ